MGCRDRTASTIAEESPREDGDVRIVENVRASWLQGGRWSIDPTPGVDIGRLDGPSTEEFVRIVGAIRIANGGIVVADQGPQELKFFDSTGTHQLTAGRRGAGPSEFRALVWIQRWWGDSVVAYDAMSRRLSFFDQRGRLGREVTVRHHPSVGLSMPLGLFGDYDCDLLHPV